MLLRLGKLSYLALLLFLVYGWIAWSPWHEQSQTVLHHGWEATRETFSQGTCFADNVYDSLKAPQSATLPTVTTTSVHELVSATPSPGTASLLANTSKSHGPTPYAYVFYATQDQYACSVLVNVQRLQDHLHTKHRIFVLASEQVSDSYIDAFEQRNVTVSIQTPPPLAEGGAPYYQDCLLKLFAFKMHHIDPSLKKVIALDSDQLVMQNLDHLFESEVEVDLAAPRAYWIAKDAISSTFMLISLSDRLWNTVNDAISEVSFDKYDMDLVNDLLSDTVMMLPGSYVTPNSHWEDWNLPKWFHAEDSVAPTKQETSATDSNTTTSAVSSESSLPVIVNRQLVANHKSSSELDTGNTSDNEVEDEGTEKMSMEDEQMHYSSGDIFDYLDRAPDDNEAAIQFDVNAAVEPSTESSLDSSEDITVVNAQAFESQVELKFKHWSLEEMQQHPLFDDLYQLAPEVPVLHFFGLGKPWSYTLEAVRLQRPGSHPLFAEQFKIWRETALQICPPGVLETL